MDSSQLPAQGFWVWLGLAVVLVVVEGGGLVVLVVVLWLDGGSGVVVIHGFIFVVNHQYGVGPVDQSL